MFLKKVAKMRHCNTCNKDFPETPEYFYFREYCGSTRVICKACQKTRVTKYKKANVDKLRNYDIDLRERAKEAVMFHYSNGAMKCACCGESNKKFLTIDHVFGRSDLETRPESGRRFYQRLIREGLPKGYQVLCFNCNCAKGIYGECPHKEVG